MWPWPSGTCQMASRPSGVASATRSLTLSGAAATCQTLAGPSVTPTKPTTPSASGWAGTGASSNLVLFTQGAFLQGLPVFGLGRLETKPGERVQVILEGAQPRRGHRPIRRIVQGCH